MSATVCVHMASCPLEECDYRQEVVCNLLNCFLSHVSHMIFSCMHLPLYIVFLLPCVCGHVCTYSYIFIYRTPFYVGLDLWSCVDSSDIPHTKGSHSTCQQYPLWTGFQCLDGKHELGNGSGTQVRSCWRNSEHERCAYMHAYI